ncbi:MAG: hypothetical protein K1X75_03600 [Leptospirales bacterium]|nr:hypothetical protein [Leptospirales bacterium]
MKGLRTLLFFDRIDARRKPRRPVWQSAAKALLLLAASLPSTMPVARLQQNELLASVQRPPAPQSARCCPLGIAYQSGPGRVVLDRVCRKPSRTEFHLRLVNLDAACTHPPGTILRDQTGHRYLMRSFRGLPSCQSAQFVSRPNARFVWSFEALPSGARTITLEEVEDETTRGLTFWVWRDVDLSHCSF